MNLDIDQLSLASTAALNSPFIPIHPLLTPLLEQELKHDIPLIPIQTHGDTSPTSTEQRIHQYQHQHQFPVKVFPLPNKGRSYVATRRIQPHELVFVAEAYGTTMCDPWLDCGVCHYCWCSIGDRQSQVRLPTTSNGKEQSDTVMVFCDETCLRLYGPEMAETICQVEAKIRRAWNDDVSSHWKLVSPTPPERNSRMETIPGATTITGTTVAPTAHYSTLIEQALSIADSRERILQLDDQDLMFFLNCVWSAVEGLVHEQESSLLYQEKPDPTTQKGYEALYPKLATYLLTGNNQATIASRISDDDCESIRLITEVLFRRLQDMQDLIHNKPKSPAAAVAAVVPVAVADEVSRVPGVRAMFADYCSMQSNELILLRQQLQQDMDEQDGSSQDWEQEQELVEDEAQEQTKDDPSHHMVQWYQLLALLPGHLLGCIYIYLRLRDAYLLLAFESEATTLPTCSSTDSSPIIPLTIDNLLFRNILFAEVANSFGIRDRSDELLGFAVFPLACFFNHSCRPNVEKKRRQGGKARQMEYWSTGVIEKGEECCISYGDILQGREERQSRLEDMYFFKCSCVRCVEEEQAERL